MSSSELPPITWASEIIGFFSFAISLATLIRVLWAELSTLGEAPAQVHFSLSNLKEALWEERDAIRRFSRGRRRLGRRRSSASRRHAEKGGHPTDYGGGMNSKIMQESVRALCKRFTELERPYLHQGFVQTSDDWDDVETATRYMDDGFQADYAVMDLGLRLRWLRTKGRVDALWINLNRLQQRRMAREVTEALA